MQRENGNKCRRVDQKTSSQCIRMCSSFGQSRPSKRSTYSILYVDQLMFGNMLFVDILLQSLLITVRWQVDAANRRTDSSHSSTDDFAACPAQNRYLEEAYRCRRSKFYELSKWRRVGRSCSATIACYQRHMWLSFGRRQFRFSTLNTTLTWDMHAINTEIFCNRKTQKN